MEKEELEHYLAEGLSLEQIGKRVGRNPSTVSYNLKKHGLKPVNQGKHANKGAIPPQILEPLVERTCPSGKLPTGWIEARRRFVTGSSVSPSRPLA
jgi:hypothetical protein